MENNQTHVLESKKIKKSFYLIIFVLLLLSGIAYIHLALQGDVQKEFYACTSVHEIYTVKENGSEEDILELVEFVKLPE